MKLKSLFILFIFNISTTYSQEPGAGNTLFFDGSSTRIVHDAIFNSVSLPITITYWVKLESSRDRAEVILSSCWVPDRTYYGFYSTFVEDIVSVSYGDGRGPLNPAFRRSKTQTINNPIDWTHVALVMRDETDMDIYINGIDIGGSYSGSGQSMDVDPTCVTLIGFLEDNNGPQYLDGQIDELAIWNASLTEIEIRNNLARKLIGGEDDLIGYWTFNEGTGNTTEELIDGSVGSIEGTVTWQLSGAGVGDESYFEYFGGGTRARLFKNETDSFWITTESDNWVGYHVYKVNDSPNSTSESSQDFSGGYYGVYPIFRNGIQEHYQIHASNPDCGVLEFRNGNDDLTWESAMNQTDSTLFYQSIGITELVFEDYADLEPLNPVFTICEGESVSINASSDCVESYFWSTGSTSEQIDISLPGSYWLERETSLGLIRDDFDVELLVLDSELIAEDRYQICSSELPFELIATVSENIVWSTGARDSIIFVNQAGNYWVEFQNSCGVVRDSVLVEVISLEETFIPNVITPNNDGLNDCFVVDRDLVGDLIEVFNRAGVKVYENRSYNNEWCPDLPSGTYYYRLFNSCTQESFKGWVSILK